MSNHIDNDDNLVDLYRASRATVDGLDSETLLAFVDGSLSVDHREQVAAQLSASPSASALVAMLTDLKADSLALAEAASERRAGRHAFGRRDQRRIAAAPQRRTARWTTAIAACAMVAVAVFAFQGARHPAGNPGAAKSDRIFSMQEDRIFDWTTADNGTAPDATSNGDRVFNSSFAKGG